MSDINKCNICDICFEKENCPYNFDRLRCKKEGGEAYYDTRIANVVLNRFRDGSIELVYYKNGFNCVVDSGNIPPIDRARKFIRDSEDNALKCIKQSEFDVQDMARSIKNSDKRSKDSLYGYALSNEWTYWVTLTINPNYFESYDYLSVREYFQKFQRFLKDKNRNVTILGIPEKHESGAIHFHSLVGTDDGKILQNISLEPAKAPRDDLISKSFYVKNGYLFDKHTGSPVFHIAEWKYGYSTAVIIPKEEDVETNRRRIANYLTKYITKDGNVEYGAHRYYKTNNLYYKDKIILNMREKDITRFVRESKLEFAVNKDKTIKNNNEMAVFLYNPAKISKNGKIDMYSQKSAFTKWSTQDNVIFVRQSHQKSFENCYSNLYKFINIFYQLRPPKHLNIILRNILS